MANVKAVSIRGTMPFNAHEHLNMCLVLGQFSMPSFGLKFSYGLEPKLVPNKDGSNGKTAMYDFAIDGREAVSISYLTSVIAIIKESGGTVTYSDCVDVEANEHCNVGLHIARQHHYAAIVECYIPELKMDQHELQRQLKDHFATFIANGVLSKDTKLPKSLEGLNVNANGIRVMPL